MSRSLRLTSVVVFETGVQACRDFVSEFIPFVHSIVDSCRQRAKLVSDMLVRHLEHV